MVCEQVTQLISAQLDHEIQPEDSARLEEHLRDCELCRSAAEAFLAQDAGLRRAYTGCDRSAARVAERVIAKVQVMPTHGASMTVKAKNLWNTYRHHVGWLLPVAAMVVAVVILAQGLGQRRGPKDSTTPEPLLRGDVVAGIGDLDFMTPRQRDKAPAVSLKVGDEIRTDAGQRRRVTLADGSILYVNQNTKVRLAADRRLTLDKGEVFVEVAPQALTNSTSATFTVETPKRAVSALGTKFAVKADDSGTNVVVTQGKVKVSGVSQVVSAGQQLMSDKDRPATAPRSTHVLDWTRDLMAAAESPLVPKSQHCGGALVALDPFGQEARLSLRKYHVDVHIEDGFARTTIDQTYFNHNAWRLEGTFYFPLPADASLSRLAMYVADGNDSNLMEGGMAERDYARNVFEQIMYTQRDPALLEWVDGSTFKMRVFPLEGRQEKRIILSYTQKLDSLYGYANYRFPSGHSMQIVGNWSFHARVKNGGGSPWTSTSHELKAKNDGNDLILDAEAKNTKPDKDVCLRLPDNSNPNGDAVRFSRAMLDGNQYLMLRYRPSMLTQAEKQRRDWVFLFEASGDRDPVVARAQIDVIKTLLENAEHEDTFSILTANTRVFTYAKDAKKATPENIKAAIDWLEKTHLIGALDLGQAIATAKTVMENVKNPVLVHVGSGVATIGDRREDVLAKSLAEEVPYVGVGIGKRWSRNLMKMAAERTGGSFTQINPDEPIAWRAFELSAMLNTPRLMNIKVVDNAEKVKFLTYASTLSQGEELCAIARIDPTDTAPQSVTVAGTLDKKTFTQTFPVQNVADKADYLPRTWAKLEIDRLLGEVNKDADGKMKKQIIDLSKAMYVMTPYTSLLVLENEQMYQQFKVDRGRKDHWAMYPCPPKIPTVYQPDPAQGIDWRVRNSLPTKVVASTNKPAPEQVMQSILVRMPPRFFAAANPYYQGLQAVNALQLASVGYAIPDPGDETNAQPQSRLAATTGRMPMAPQTNSFGGMNSGPGGLMAPPMSMPAAARGDQMEMGALRRNAAIDRNVDGRFRQPAREREQAEAGQQGQQMLQNFDRQQLSTMQSAGEILGALQAMEKAKQAAGDGKGEGRKRTEETTLSAEAVIGRLISGMSRSSMLYQRPGFGGDERIFSDLVAHAPAMNTSHTDILTVLDLEAKAETANAPGKVDEAAAKLIEQARAATWSKITFSAEGRQSAFSVVFNGAGQFRFERTLPEGLREIAVCDGKTVVHLYPELGIGARRELSRFHRADFAELVPWSLLPIEDMARGNNVQLIDANTVHIVAKDIAKDAKTHSVLKLVFANGRLSEKHLVEMPSGKVLAKESYAASGEVTWTGADGKVTAKRQLKVENADAPELTPDVKKLVVLPLPYRTPQQVYQAFELKDWNFNNYNDEAALAMFAAQLWQNNPWQAQNIFHQRFYNRGNRSLGFYTLLASANMQMGQQSGWMHVLAVHGQEPVAKYLAVLGDPNRRLTTPVGDIGGANDGFVQQLSAFRDRYIHWNSGKASSGDAATRTTECNRVLDYVRENSSTVYGWALLVVAREKLAADKDLQKKLTEALKPFEQMPGLAFAARYETARSLLNDGQRSQARKQFAALYEETQRQENGVPAIDAAFRQALRSDDTYKQDVFGKLLRQTATTLIAQQRRTAVITLAWQCRQLEDAKLADELFELALKDLPQQERLATTLAGVEYLWQTGQQDRADEMVQKLLANASFGRNPSLWRLASQMAGQRKLLKRQVEYFDKALEMEYRQLPTVINLQRVRSDYGRLLNAYQQVAVAMNLLETPVTPDFTAKVVRAADRWRSLDSDSTAACHSAARILKYLGAKELAWDYMTTPTAMKPNESAPQLALAQTLRNDGESDLADKAYVLAFEAEPTNAQILFERAQALQQAGKLADAQRVYRQIAESDWQPRFQWLKHQARWQLGIR